MDARDKANIAQIEAKIENANKEIQKKETIKITLLNQKNAITQKKSQEKG